MKPLPHLYEVTLSSAPKGYATLSTDGAPALRSAPPRDFGGPGDAWSPEHLLLASLESCFLFTFRAVAEASKFDFLSFEVAGSGTVDRKDGANGFIDIVLKSRSTVQKRADLEPHSRKMAKGKIACIVTTSVTVRVRLATAC